MGVPDIAVALMLVYVHSAFGEIEVVPGQPFNCNNYTDVVKKEYFCRPDGLFAVSDDVMNDGMFTREELLEEVRKTCSNGTLLKTYFDCLEDLVVECPVQSVFILDIIEDQLGMFCDGTNVSEWLLTTVRNGYTFNQECVSVSRELLIVCAKELAALHQQGVGSNVNLTTALEVLQQVMSDMFQCSENEFSSMPASYQDCGSSWQDMLLTVWLPISSRSVLGGHLLQEDRLRLQAVMTGQTA